MDNPLLMFGIHILVQLKNLHRLSDYMFDIHFQVCIRPILIFDPFINYEKIIYKV